MWTLQKEQSPHLLNIKDVAQKRQADVVDKYHIFKSLPRAPVKIRRNMLNFISFGSSSSGNCYFFYNDDDNLMIDIGVGIRTLKKSFGNYGLKLSQVQNILVTHDHADHIKSVGSISKDLDLPVYTTTIVHQGIDRNHYVKSKVPAHNKHIVENGVEQKVGNFSVTPFHVPHDSMDCVGYIIVYKGMTIVLATDVGSVTEEIKKAVGMADYLIIEANHDEDMLKNGPYPAHLKQRVAGACGHLSNKCCAETIAEYSSEKLKHIWLCHLSEENNHPELARITVEQMLAKVRNTPVKVDVLKRKIPTGIFTLSCE